MNREKVGIITSITGQAGAYLVRHLLDKAYVVHAIKRRSSSFNTQRVDQFYVDPNDGHSRFYLHYGDLTDANNLVPLIQEHQPPRFYDLAEWSHVQVSFENHSIQ